MRMFLFLFLLPFQLVAQDKGFLPFKKYPFPTELTAAATGSRIAWAMDEEGRRNIYVAEGPAFTPRRLTDFSSDDGQEISSLSVSSDGQWVVFVRGGDHGANWESGLPVDPAFAVQPFHMQVACIPFDGGRVRYLSEGDYPVVCPDSKKIAFVKNGQVWLVGLDSGAATNAFTSRGNMGSLQWSPDGRQLLFVANRTDHAIIGVYTPGSPALRWIAPAFARDQSRCGRHIGCPAADTRQFYVRTYPAQCRPATPAFQRQYGKRSRRPRQTTRGDGQCQPPGYAGANTGDGIGMDAAAYRGWQNLGILQRHRTAAATAGSHAAG
ncbi:MAG TPA: hypothetical protein VN616_00320 [Puia sp.]|nr:hypothetical protein [Puia sp.]